MSILMSCPLCGSIAEFDYAEQDDGMGYAQCTNRLCGLSIFDDKDAAIEKWNTRTADRTINRLRGQLQNCVNHLDIVNRRGYSVDLTECIESANKALYETLSK